MAYKFNQEAAEGGGGDWPVLEEGDYGFVVTSCSFPIENEKGYDVIHIELLVSDQKVWDNRSAGVGPKGEFDMISPFLAAINRIPKPNQEKSPVFWAQLAGAKGKAHIVQDEYQGKKRNKVGFYHAPKQLDPGKRAHSGAGVIKPDPTDDLNMGKEPDEIPF